MIAYLNGTIRKKAEKSLILEVNNVGYLVNCPIPTLEKYNEKDFLEVFIYTKVREDDISLFGFETEQEIDLFKLLISVNGVGAKTAMEIMSQNLENVKNAIVSKDTAFLSKIPGIGKKTAERIIVELQNKLNWDITSATRDHLNVKQDVNDDILNALVGLGYQKYEIIRILKNMPTELNDPEEIITYFLRNV
jgi:holliday junction DNA helicase RuvA